LLQEFFEDLWVEHATLKKLEAEGELQGEGRARIVELEQILLDSSETLVDPLIEKWERELREGKTPNLEEDWNPPKR
jgi:hypothetical protein